MSGIDWNMLLTQISHRNVSFIVYLSTAARSWDVPTHLGVMYDKSVMLRDMISSLMAEIRLIFMKLNSHTSSTDGTLTEQNCIQVGKKRQQSQLPSIDRRITKCMLD
jgi:hypothetical protein